MMMKFAWIGYAQELRKSCFELVDFIRVKQGREGEEKEFPYEKGLMSVRGKRAVTRVKKEGR